MTSDYLALGPVPNDEFCAAFARNPDFPKKSSRECRVFQRMLERLFPVPEGVAARLTVKTFQHEFGAYREVCAVYDPQDQAAVDYALRVASHAPSCWDAQARGELAWYEKKADYFVRLQLRNITLRGVPLRYRRIDPPANLMTDDSCAAASAVQESVSKQQTVR
jgi:hypothetical protein